MQGYGHDESAPTPGGMFVGCFCGRSLIFFGMSWRISWVNVDISRSVRNVFILCMLHNHRTKVWFLSRKKGFFAM